MQKSRNKNVRKKKNKKQRIVSAQKGRIHESRCSIKG